MSAKGDLQKLIRNLRKQGFTVTQASNMHYLVDDPDGNRVVVIPHTPSDHRSMKNVLAALRRAGYRP